MPADRRLKLEIDLPEDMPTGAVDMVLTLSPATGDENFQALRKLAGKLANSKAFSRDAVEIQREMRDEWE